MASALDSSSSNPVKDGPKLSVFEDYSDGQYELLIRKGVYPYEYMLNCDKFEETKLPAKEAFITCVTLTLKITNTHKEFGKDST